MNSQSHAKRTRPLTTPTRRGVALILLVVTLGVGTLILMSAVRVTMLQGVSLGREGRFVQARQYALAAFARAQLQLQSESGFKGERWNIPGFQDGEKSPATAVISVRPVPNHADERNVQVQIEFRSESVGTLNYHSEQIISLKPSAGPNP